MFVINVISGNLIVFCSWLYDDKSMHYKYFLKRLNELKNARIRADNVETEKGTVSLTFSPLELIFFQSNHQRNVKVDGVKLSLPHQVLLLTNLLFNMR